MARAFTRLVNPSSIAVIGGGAWCDQVIGQARRFGFSGPIWPVHPTAGRIGGAQAYAGLDDLPGIPDAAFIGINRHATIDSVGRLAEMGTGGAVCFASGFHEAAAEDDSGVALQQALVAAAGDMPILGPNCYGFINALDGALLWPDQHGCAAVDRGVAILTQSSNIAINLTMQQRALPIGYVVTCGNMAQTTQAQIATALLDDPRVTAIGLHIEGFGDLRDWEILARQAYAKGVPLVAVKVGLSEQAQKATISHTASLAGSDAGAQAFLDRLGIARLSTLPDLLETMKLLHCQGPLPHGNIASISCSGGEASLIADMAAKTPLNFPPLRDDQKMQLGDALGDRVALGNPLDYHTYIWRDQAAMAQAWGAMTGDHIAMTLSIVDYPTTDATDWAHATAAALAVRRDTGAPFGVAASLPELMPPDVAHALMQGGVVPFMGLSEALSAIAAATQIGPPHALPVCLAGTVHCDEIVGEANAKQVLTGYGLQCPRNRTLKPADVNAQALGDLRPPFAVKGVGLAHKTDQGAVRLNVSATDIAAAAADIGTVDVLIEEMITGTIAELLIGVVRDPAHGFVLTLGAGGVLTEIWRDTTSLLLPAEPHHIRAALHRLRIAPTLQGYRGRPGVDIAAIVSAVQAVQTYVIENADTVGEVEINPLLCTPDRAVAADALIRRAITV